MSAGAGTALAGAGTDMQITPEALDLLMPLHLWVSPTGHIRHAGATLRKLCPETELAGQRLLEIFEIRRPRGVRVMADLLAAGAEKVQLAFRAAPRQTLKGLVVALPGDEGALLNLSLGISVLEAVERHALTSNDFAPSDPTVEMLYLIEAQTAVLAESRKLNMRLEGARLAAEEQAFTDTLTGLSNRRAMDHVLARLAMPPAVEPFGLMHIDLDFFKQVNDTHGHAAGDHVLQHVARILTEETRAGDMVVRVGGDEFVLICRGSDDPMVLDKIARRIIDRLEKPIPFGDIECHISASIGTTVSSRYAKLDPEQMMNDADTALYASKEQGRARHTIFGAPFAAESPADGASRAAPH